MLNLKFMKIGSPSLISSSLRFEWYDIKKSILARKSFANPAVLCLNRFICSMVVERLIVSVTINQREFSDSHHPHPPHQRWHRWGRRRQRRSCRRCSWRRRAGCPPPCPSTRASRTPQGSYGPCGTKVCVYFVLGCLLCVLKSCSFFIVGFPNWHVSGCQEQVGLGTWLLFHRAV